MKKAEYNEKSSMFKTRTLIDRNYLFMPKYFGMGNSLWTLLIMQNTHMNHRCICLKNVSFVCI